MVWSYKYSRFNKISSKSLQLFLKYPNISNGDHDSSQDFSKGEMTTNTYCLGCLNFSKVVTDNF